MIEHAIEEGFSFKHIIGVGHYAAIDQLILRLTWERFGEKVDFRFVKFYFVKL